MYLFFYGDNEFLLDKKLRELKDKYRQKAGGNLNLITFEGASMVCEDFLTQVQIVPLLATSRLIVVRNVFAIRSKNSLDKIKDFLPKITKTTIVVFAHVGKIDKRLGLYKALTKSKNAHEFKAMDPRQQMSFARREIEDKGSKIDDEALELLSDYCQGDMFALSHEIEKLSLYRYEDEIKTGDVESMVSQGVSSDVFRMIDSLSSGDRKGALQELKKLYANGEPGLRIMAMINYQYRLIAQVKEAQETAKSPFEVSKLAGVSYFQVNKVYDIAKRMTWEDLHDIYSKMLRFDESIKTGRIGEEEGIKELVITLYEGRDLLS